MINKTNSLHEDIYPLDLVLQIILQTHKHGIHFLDSNPTTNIVYIPQLSVAAYTFFRSNKVRKLDQMNLNQSDQCKCIYKRKK